MKIAKTIGCLALVGLSGCCNINTRVEGEFAPYACAPHPYFCTAEIWPDVALSRTYLCGTAAGMAVGLWPITVIDEVFEVACDTVLLPVDLTGMYCRTDEQRKKLAEIRERRKEIAERYKQRKKRAEYVPRRITMTPPSASAIPVLRPVGSSSDGANAAVPAEAAPAASAETVSAPANKQGVKP